MPDAGPRRLYPVDLHEGHLWRRSLPGSVLRLHPRLVRGRCRRPVSGVTFLYGDSAMTPRLTAEQRDTVMDGCVEIKNVGGHCVLMSIEAFRAMLRLRIDGAHID